MILQLRHLTVATKEHWIKAPTRNLYDSAEKTRNLFPLLVAIAA